MADKHIWEIESASTMSDEDRLLIVVGTSEFLISKSDFQKTLGGLNSTDTAKLSKIIIDGDGSRVLTNNGEYISIADLYKDKHNHSNKTILDKFTVDSDGKLLYDGTIVGSDYELPIATSDTLGGIKVDGNTITINENGVISGSSNYELPVATTSVLGGVKPDGTTITVDENGVISGASTYELPKATTTNLGGIMVDGITITVNSDGVITCINEGSVIATWASNVEYPVNCVIVYETTMYKCLETHTSDDTFDSTKWTALTGEKGDAGISPIVKTEQTETGAIISVTDVNGTTTSVISNGINGITPHIDETSKNWMIGEIDTGVIAEGKNGISPTATVIKTDTGATITVTSGEQTTTADIENGITTIQTTSVKYIGTLTVDDWIGDTVPYTQTITMENITTDVVADFGIVITKDDIQTALDEKKQWGYITSVETIDGGIKFYCFEIKPTIDLNYQMRVV